MSREYSMEERAVALAIYVEKGVAEAWRQTGIPKPTIASWARRGRVHTNAPVKTQAATAQLQANAAKLRAELRLRLLEKAADLLDRMDAEHIDFKGKDAGEVVYPIAPAGAVQNYATSVGILIEKFRLEMGEVTDRTEALSITDGLDPDTKRALRERLARSVRGESQPEGAADAAERAGTGVDPRTAPDPA